MTCNCRQIQQDTSEPRYKREHTHKYSSPEHMEERLDSKIKEKRGNDERVEEEMATIKYNLKTRPETCTRIIYSFGGGSGRKLGQESCPT